MRAVGSYYQLEFSSRGGAMSFLLCLLAGAKPSAPSRAVTKLSTSLSLLLLQDNDSKVDSWARGGVFSKVRGGPVPVDDCRRRLSYMFRPPRASGKIVKKGASELTLGGGRRFA